MIDKGAKAGFLVENSEGKVHGGGSESHCATEPRKTQSVKRRQLEFGALVHGAPELPNISILPMGSTHRCD